MIILLRLFSFLVLGLSLVTPPRVHAVETDNDAFKPIFNGKDLNGWEGNTNFWSVKDGMIQGQTTAENPTKGNTFL
ncbi:MAG: DUF1080 domain-containing protein, partial [Verrucomicrobia bacterium]|nr:DUF1080 domain-containing protein [Verrucomicrobiota bacterium]